MSLAAFSDSDDTRTRILLAAGPIFAEQGFEKATVRAICRVADVNIASIKYYFGDKKKLYVQTVLFARQLRADRYPEAATCRPATPEERLYEFVSTLLRRLTAMGDASWPLVLLMRELMQPDEACRQIVREYFEPAFRILLRVIDALSARPLSETGRLMIGFSIIGQCLHYRFGREIVALMVPEPLKADFGIEQIASHITEFTIAALRQPAAKNSLEQAPAS